MKTQKLEAIIKTEDCRLHKIKKKLIKQKNPNPITLKTEVITGMKLKSKKWQVRPLMIHSRKFCLKLGDHHLYMANGPYSAVPSDPQAELELPGRFSSENVKFDSELNQKS